MTTKIYKAQLHWKDVEAPPASGWWLRYLDSAGVQQRTEIDGDAYASICSLATSCVAALPAHHGTIVVFRDNVRFAGTITLSSQAPPIGLELADEVEFIGTHANVTTGTQGVVDLFSLENPARFWVLVDDGGFFGWTTLASWKPTGKKRKANPDWWAARQEAHAHQAHALADHLKNKKNQD